MLGFETVTSHWTGRPATTTAGVTWVSARVKVGVGVGVKFEVGVAVGLLS